MSNVNLLHVGSNPKFGEGVTRMSLPTLRRHCTEEPERRSKDGSLLKQQHKKRFLCITCRTRLTCLTYGVRRGTHQVKGWRQQQQHGAPTRPLHPPGPQTSTYFPALALGSSRTINPLAIRFTARSAAPSAARIPGDLTPHGRTNAGTGNLARLRQARRVRAPTELIQKQD